MAAQAVTLARPYARAAFEVAHGAGALDAWSQSLAFAAAVAKDARVAAFGNDPRVSPAQLAVLHRPEGMGQDEPFALFLAELAEQQRMALLPQIEELYEAYRRESESQLRVVVTSAIALDVAQAEQLKASLKRRFKREIELETQVDSSLLGGVVIDADGEVIDGSARGRLERLASALAN